ncbi:TCR/Tet family MFS transporter [Lutimaribacter sp. EGI FJ00015]|uniref:TCR/Tet family MFS transporter n=1 Tax=Lutimaribacter degradans TaxID=2945989 RepID=A0ACC5ZYR6_9RHOB|nr:TCR/Tet family MFS transporter [Lutimaribacter sp. EGI FJ00013]MCM2562896.1 TCR/Tet family MFS transporter [Lutimaribacter sp. EGI FJ00013]MCO0614063.1 TCR/Tet family MFS transporter [Lutimaribacter sp. EGI FJ00015]MCO0636041.1 TCR/Tet family MFS transporter [Lutimaribacter sp. EGI FJ00014]
MPLPVLFILVTVILNAMGIGLILPVMPDLIVEVAGRGIASAAVWGGILSASFAVMQFLFAPLVGNLSDAFGRRPVMLLSLFAMALDYIVMALAGSIWLLLAGRIFGGITAATNATATAYMADISQPAEKARNFGLIGAGFGVGFVFGPMLGGLLAEYGTRAPFYAAAALSFANMCLGAMVLRETVTDTTRRSFVLHRANPFGAFRALARLPDLTALLWVFFFFQVATMVYPAIWAYFTTERFAWSPGLIGLSLAVYGTSIAVVQGVLVRPVIRLMGERMTVIFGLGTEVISLVILGFITSGTAVMFLIPVTALGAIGMPALQGIMSRLTPDNAQGELQGVLASVTSVAMILAPVVMTQTFAAFTAPVAPVYLPGAPFLLSAFLMAISLALFRRRVATAQA